MVSKTFTKEFYSPNLPDADVRYFNNFLTETEAALFFTKLSTTLIWQQHHIKIFGKKLPQPRLSALYAESEQPYSYSGLTLNPLPFTKELKVIQNKIKEVTPSRFTHCLANLYRDGKDSMGLHADDEKELGENPVIASLSLGASRKFRLKHKYDKSLKFEIDLEPGSLLIMQGPTQHYWKHELPKTSVFKEPRINLTYRKII